MEPYKWVSSGSIAKFNRAILEFKNKNKQLVAQGKEPEEITEARIKSRYTEMAGLVLHVDEPVEEPVEETKEEKISKMKGRWNKKEDAE